MSSGSSHATVARVQSPATGVSVKCTPGAAYGIAGAGLGARLHAADASTMQAAIAVLDDIAACSGGEAPW
jgi:hypothetical protein